MPDLSQFYQSSLYYKSHDGLSLHYRDIGINNGQFTIVCLPGLTRNSKDFELLATYLAQNNRVICPDLRGRGLSDYDFDWKNYNINTYVQDIWALFDALDITNSVIIGTSLGGLIAMAMAFEEKSRIKGIVLNDIGPEIDPIGLKRIKEYAGKLPPVNSWDEACAQTKLIYGQSLNGIEESRWLELTKRAYKENHDKKPELDMDFNIGKAINKVGAQTGDPWQHFEAMNGIESMVIRGEISDILTKAIVNKMKIKNPSLHSITVPDRGHVPLLDETISLIAINKFLKRVKQ